MLTLASGAAADNAPSPDPFAKYADPSSVVLAVQTDFEAPGGAVRLLVYEDAENFLEVAALKYAAELDEEGVAIMPLRTLRPGDYAFVAYYDQNGDGRLNRGGVLGRPKEPFAFSNGVKPKLRKPRFEEAKVDVTHGAVVVLTLEE